MDSNHQSRKAPVLQTGDDLQLISTGIKNFCRFREFLLLSGLPPLHYRATCYCVFKCCPHCHTNLIRTNGELGPCFGSFLFLAWFQHSYKFIGHAGFGPAEPPDPKSGALPGWANVRWKSYLNGFRQILNYLQHNLSLASLSPGGFEPTVSARLSSGPTASIGWGQRISI